MTFLLETFEVYFNATSFHLHEMTFYNWIVDICSCRPVNCQLFNRCSLQLLLLWCGISCCVFSVQRDHCTPFHNEHIYFFLPGERIWYVFLYYFSLFLEWKPFLQWSQTCILFRCFDCVWLLKPDFVLKDVLHISHFSVSFTCTLFMWSFKLLFFVNDLSHSMHWCRNFLCSLFMWW